MSDERKHCESAASEWMLSGGGLSSSLDLADLIQQERTGLLTRAEAAEAEKARQSGFADTWARKAQDYINANAGLHREIESLRGSTGALIGQLRGALEEARHVLSCAPDVGYYTTTMDRVQAALAATADKVSKVAQADADLFLCVNDYHEGCKMPSCSGKGPQCRALAKCREARKP